MRQGFGSRSAPGRGTTPEGDMVSQHFCPRPYRSACDDARSRSAAAHRRGSGHTADVLHEGRPTPRGWGSTGRGLCVLHDSPTYVEYTHPSPSSPRPSCSGQRLRERFRHGTVDMCEITAGRPHSVHTSAICPSACGAATKEVLAHQPTHQSRRLRGSQPVRSPTGERKGQIPPSRRQIGRRGTVSRLRDAGCLSGSGGAVVGSDSVNRYLRHARADDYPHAVQLGSLRNRGTAAHGRPTTAGTSH